MSVVSELIPDELDVDSGPTFADRIRSRIVTTDELASIPPPTPLVEGMLDLDNLAMLYGASGVGKSFLAIDIALHLAAGRQWWHGCELTPTRPLYVVAEGVSGVQLRTKAWSEHHGIDAPMHWHPGALNVFDTAQAVALAEVAQELGSKLIVIDTLARSISGADENTARDAGHVIDNLSMIREQTGACVLVVHHSGKDRSAGGRGSSAFKGAVDTELEVVGSVDSMKLLTQKQKNRAEAAPITFRLVPVPDTGSGVLLSGAAAASGEVPAGVMQTYESLAAIEIPGGIGSKAWREQVSDTHGTSEASFHRHRRALLDLGWVENVGTQKRPSYMVRSDS